MRPAAFPHTRRCRTAGLVQRITLLASALALIVLLPALALSYSALHALVMKNARHELEAASARARLRFEARLEADLKSVFDTSRLSVLSNTLADPSEGGRFVRPILEDQCRNAQELETLLLSDFKGQQLEQGCTGEDTLQPRLAALLVDAIALGRATHAVRRDAGSLKLLVAAPVEYLPTGSHEGALGAVFDLDRMFAELKHDTLPGGHRLRLHETSARAPGRATLDREALGLIRFRTPIANSLGLPLAAEASMPRGVVYRPIHSLIAGFVGVGALVLLGVVLLARRFARYIAAPLAELERTAQRIGQGDFSQLPDIDADASSDSNDSFRQLAATVHRMIVALRDTQRQLSDTLAERSREVAQAEARLHAEERAHLRRIEHLHEVIIEIDLERRIRFLNGAWTQLTGHTVAECIGRDYLEFMHPDDLRRHAPRLQALREMAPEGEGFECRVIRRDGSHRWVSVRVSALEDDDGQVAGFSGMLIDVTERHAADMAIAIRDRAIESATSGITIVDLRRSEQPIVYVNRAFERITGYSAEETVGRNARFLHAGSLEQSELAKLRAAIATRQPCKVTLRNFRRDGSPFWNELSISPVVDAVSGEVTHFVGVQNDITARKEADDLLLDWLTRLDVVFTLSPDALVCFDNAGTVGYANSTADRIFGQRVGALSGMSIGDFKAVLASLADPAQPFTPFEDVDPGTDPERFAEGIVHLQHPARRALHLTARRCDAGATSLVLYFRDVTREVELDRMKSDFLATAAHELRTPMSSIMGFSELLLMRNFDATRTRDMLGTINRQAQRLTSLLNDLLDLARIEARKGDALRLETQPLSELLADALAGFHVPDGKHPLVARVSEGLPDVSVDRGKFQQALLNLLSNARKFSPEGGAIEVDVLHPHPEGLALVGIAVRDHGIGMTEDEVAHAFERFYRADRSGHIPGTGLGLPLVREIMKLHGGSVDLASEPGAGTCVTLWFPLPSGSKAANDADTHTPHDTPTSANA